ncbi:lysosomal amino acid transporter 1 homolog [Mytilus trossulus]|uniref:lysosomal amino acid transporter 1 homolog n=1 Tax=Mytilus trossulus TaxID=6551 RepID=UPI00300698D7
MPHLFPWLLGGHHYDSIHNLTKGNCSDGVRWLYVLLGDCVTNSNEYASDIFGLLSIALWVFVSTPQMVSNCRNIQGVAGISVFLITQWTLGDTTNLIGSILTGQMPLQIYLAVYFVFSDLVLFSQYIWYQVWRRKQKKKAQHQPSTLILCLTVGFLVMNGLFQGYLPSSRPLPARHHPAGRNLLHVEIFHGIEDEVGYAIGVISSLFYIGSRLAQLYKNYKRKSTDGLSLMMFWLAILGNVTYGLSILVRSIEPDWIVMHLPWLVGSLGVVLLDVSLVIQFRIYSATDFERLSNEKMTEEEIQVDANGVVNYGGHENYGSINNPDPVPAVYSNIRH